MDSHGIPKQVLDRFAHHTATPDEQRTVIRHLLAGCESCRGYLARIWPSFRNSKNVVELSPTNYDSAFTKAQPLASGTMQGVLAELEHLPPLRQELLIRNHPRFWRREICEELVDSSHAARFSSMHSMRHRSWLAVLVSERIKPKRGRDEAQVADLKARAWLGYANALRVSGDYNAADQAFLNTQAQMKLGSGALPLRARILKQLGSLRLDQLRFGASRLLIRETTEIWRDLHDRQEVARCLVLEANAANEEGNPGAALGLLDQAERIIDSTADPKLGLIILHNRTRYLSESGQVEAAFDLHEEVTARFASLSEPLLHTKLIWSRGQLLSDKGYFEPAIEALSVVQQDLLRHGNRCDAARVSIELAHALGKVGRRYEMRKLAAYAFQEMAAQRIAREGLAALILLRKSA